MIAPKLESMSKEMAGKVKFLKVLLYCSLTKVVKKITTSCPLHLTSATTNVESEWTQCSRGGNGSEETCDVLSGNFLTFFAKSQKLVENKVEMKN